MWHLQKRGWPLLSEVSYLNGFYFISQQTRSTQAATLAEPEIRFFFFKFSNISSSINLLLSINSAYTDEKGKPVFGHTYSSFS